MPAQDYAWALFRKLHGQNAPLPNYYFIEAWDVDPMDQLPLQSRVQAYVDQSISKTIIFRRKRVSIVIAAPTWITGSPAQSIMDCSALLIDINGLPQSLFA